MLIGITTLKKEAASISESVKKLPIRSDKSQEVQFSSEMPLKDQITLPSPPKIFVITSQITQKPVKVQMPGMTTNPRNRYEGEVAE
jgi:hypothetical protein